MVLTRGVGDAGWCVRRFLGAGCGRRVRRFHAVGSREVGAGAWGVWGNAAIKLVGGSLVVLTTVVAAGGGRNFKEIDRTGRLPQTERLTMPT